MTIQPLSAEQLRYACDPTQFDFETTADLSPTDEIIGQPRGAQAIQFGIGIDSEGYNIYVLGPVGTGRTTTITRYLEAQARRRPIPADWVYVHDFAAPHRPRAVQLPAGEGRRFRERMARLIADLRQDLPPAFRTETYQTAVEAVKEELAAQRDGRLQQLRQQAAAEEFALVRLPAGLTVVPVQNGRPLSPQAVPSLDTAQQQARHELNLKLERTVAHIHRLEAEARAQIGQIDRDVAANAIRHHFDRLREAYTGRPEALHYLDEVYQDVLSQIDGFAPRPEAGGAPELDLRRYEVNVLVDNDGRTGAPVIVESHPTYHNLFGRIEYEVRSGVVFTHFSNIKAGSLHRANGGYLILEADDLLQESQAWGALKRVLKARQIRVEASGGEKTQVVAKTLDPEPIPLAVKVILLGSIDLYYFLYDRDEDFRALFKVRADFEDTMPRRAETVRAYAAFIATRCHEEGLRPFAADAVAAVVSFGARLAEHQQKLSTRFGAVADLAREASYWAGQNGRSPVTAADVRQALDERIRRANRLEEEIREEILDDTIFIATTGSVVGQVNGLSIIDTGEYAFGQPGRITARTFMGEDGIVHIERETQMSGPIHEKGVLTLTGYLGGMYAQDQPLTLSASLTFEQNYGGVEGDSAASTELYALLSSLSGIPLRQGVAVTGSVNQRGEVQPIGGVNEKVEGFFRVCAARGLSGDQGVIIPASNAVNLMLHEDVVQAVAAGDFHIWPVRTVDEALPLLMGKEAGERDKDGRFPPDTVHYAVQRRLQALARALKSFGDEEDEADEEMEDGDQSG